MYGAVGFFLSGSLALEAKEKAVLACGQALSHFPWLERKRLQHGSGQLELWSHHNPDSSTYVDNFGNLFTLIGPYSSTILWEDAIEQLEKQGDNAFELPWEGRCVLIRISRTGEDWTIWNDWCGSIPVFHIAVNGLSFVSSLEPLIVAAAGFTSKDFSKRGIIEMLVHGHFLGTDTLFAKMQKLIPDAVSCWSKGVFDNSRILWTVKPSDIRWEKDQDKLIEEMYEYTVKALDDTFCHHNEWILPLSGGMDSRLIACRSVKAGVDIQAFTYGPSKWNETVYAQKVARALSIPWQRVDLGTDYLASYTPMWLDWFGSSLHTHGMYQMPFLQSLEKIDAPIILGFMGEALAGHHLKVLNQSGSTPYQWFCNFGVTWNVKEATRVLAFDPSKIFSEISNLMQDQFDLLKGAKYQRQMFLDFWNRQHNFIFYQSMMHSYLKGVYTPYMNREYARFCLSLPQFALKGRYLQKKMLKRYWPEAAKISSTYSQSSLVEAGWSTAKQMAKYFLPWKVVVKLMRSFGVVSNTMDLDCVKATGWKSLFPLNKDFDGQDIFNVDEVLNTAWRVQNYSQKDYSKVKVLQCIIYRMLQKR
ncbi:MAG: asparagine synthase-related protein [Candidatus Omnitrophota bacterium]